MYFFNREERKEGGREGRNGKKEERKENGGKEGGKEEQRIKGGDGRGKKGKVSMVFSKATYRVSIHAHLRRVLLSDPPVRT